MFNRLLTETRNPDSTQIDEVSTEESLRIINRADQTIAESVESEIPQIAQAVDAIFARVRTGGKLFYIGAGTSGRLGVLDASECPPTFNVSPDLVQGIIAGGDIALRNAVERAEDNRAQGRADLIARRFSEKDSLVGIAASGRTPYVLGALQYAREMGALTIGLSCSPNSEIGRAAEIAITPLPGPEVITGSTRMRAGTATKLVLNMISTGLMIRLGYVYGNLMVNVKPTNKKLEDRACRIITEIAQVPYDEAEHLLQKAGNVRVAILMHKLEIPREEAERRLAASNGSLKAALRENSAS